MDIFSCESQMIAASYSDENTRQMVKSPTTIQTRYPFGFDLGPSGPNNNSELNLVSHLQICICCF